MAEQWRIEIVQVRWTEGTADRSGSYLHLDRQRFDMCILLLAREEPHFAKRRVPGSSVAWIPTASGYGPARGEAC